MKKFIKFFIFIFTILLCQVNLYALTDREILNELFSQTGGVPNNGTGNTWLRSQNWGTPAALNTWYGVQTDANGRVISLDLDNNPNTFPAWGSDGATNGLSGTLPTSLGGLTELRYLAITSNPNLHGTVPVGLNKLEQMFLQANHLDGPIPDLSAYSNLLFLYLNNNNLTDGFPGNLGALSNLIVMHLGDNPSLGGYIPSTWAFPSMSELWLQNTGIGGTIPINIGTNIPNLTFLQLHHNKLIGGIPTSLGQLHQMAYLALSYNQLDDLIPDFVMPNAQEIMLNHNKLMGNIPPSFNIFTNLGNLPKLHLENNFLEGDIPSFNNLPSLNEINVSNNKFIFGDMENDAWLNVANRIYAPQAKIPIQNNNCNLSVHVGGTPSLETFNWFNPSPILPATVGSNTHQATSAGTYHCEATHSGLPQLTLISEDTIVNCKPSPCTCKDLASTFFQSQAGCNYTFGFGDSTCIKSVNWYVDGNYVGVTGGAGANVHQITLPLANGTHTIAYNLNIQNGADCIDTIDITTNCDTCVCGDINPTFTIDNKGCDYHFSLGQFDCIKKVNWYVDGAFSTTTVGTHHFYTYLSNGWHFITYEVILTNGEVCKRTPIIESDCSCTCEAVQAAFYQINNGKCNYTFGIKGMEKCIEGVKWYIDDENGNPNTNFISGLNPNEINVTLANGLNTITYVVYLTNGEVCKFQETVDANCGECCEKIQAGFSQWQEGCTFGFSLKNTDCIEKVDWYVDGNLVGSGTNFNYNFNQGSHSVCYVAYTTKGNKCEYCVKIFADCCNCEAVQAAFTQINNGNCNYTLGIKGMEKCIEGVEWSITDENGNQNTSFTNSGSNEINVTLVNGWNTITYVAYLANGEKCKFEKTVYADCSPCTCEEIEATFYQSNRGCDYTFGVADVPCISSIEWFVDGNLVGTTAEITTPVAGGTHMIHYIIKLTDGTTCIYCFKMNSDCCDLPNADVTGHLLSCPGYVSGVVILNSPYQITWLSPVGIQLASGTLMTITGLPIGTYEYTISDGYTKCLYTVTILEDGCCLAIEKSKVEAKKANATRPLNIAKPIEDITVLQAIPNPANEVLTLKFLASKVADRTIALYTGEGKLVIQKKLDSTDTSIEFDSSNFPNGIFIAQLLEQGKIVNSAKVVIQH